MIDSVCSNCGEPGEPILLRLATSNGEVLATFNEEESKLFLDAAIHYLLDTVVAPVVRKNRAAHGEPQ